MDLLRLVLARQPMAKLVFLPRLLESERFISIRMKTVNTKSRIEGEDYESQCAREGEIFPNAMVSVDEPYLLYRSIFLLQPAAVKHFSKYPFGYKDFWYALSTGVPEIWDTAFEWLPWDISLLKDYNSLYELPWNDDLRSRFQSFFSGRDLERLDRQGKELIAPLIGLSGLSYSGEFLASYIAGSVRRLLDGKVVLTRIPEVENLLNRIGTQEKFSSSISGMWKYYAKVYAEAGYLYRIIKDLNETTDHDDWAVDVALQVANEELLVYLSEHAYSPRLSRSYTLGDNVKITRQFVERVRRILANERIQKEKLFSQDMLLSYQIIAGDILNIRVGESLRKKVGNPGPVKREHFEYEPRSLQALVVYDPRYMKRNATFRSEAFRRGLVFE